jgi:hypothetical protein
MAEHRTISLTRDQAARRQRIAADLDLRAEEPTRPFDETTERLNAWRSQRDGSDAA